MNLNCKMSVKSEVNLKLLHKEFQKSIKSELANEEWRAMKDEFKNDTIGFINKVKDRMKDLSTQFAKQKAIGIMKFLANVTKFLK